MLKNSRLEAILRDLCLGLEEVFFTTASLDGLGLGARDLDCPTPLFNFSIGLLEEEVKPTHERQS